MTNEERQRFIDLLEQDAAPALLLRVELSVSSGPTSTIGIET
jgi:hypothetical protein